MTEIRVWAPRAQRSMALEVEGRRRPMDAAGDGWWVAEVAGPGIDYGVVVDGEGPFPDPRSLWQPAGVHGPSRTVDLAALDRGDDHWRGADPRDGVIYELHVGTFSPRGGFDGVVERLDHLVALGVGAVELLPVVEFPGARNWGYDGVALYAPHHAYGGPEGLARLVGACHERGLAVILDVVYNHLGPEGNYLDRFGPYFTDFYATPWGRAMNYDQADSDEVRRFALDNALMWFRDYGVDALRLDAVHAIIDTSAVHLLEEMATEAAELSAAVGRPLTLIAESDLNDPRLCRSRELGGYGVHAQWSDDYHHALHAALTGETDGYYVDFGGLGPLATALERGWVYTGQRSTYRRRRHGRAPEGLSGRHLLAYGQNHDQVGNRAVGDRLGALLGPARQRIAAALTLTSPFVPLVFAGEEWGTATPFLYFTDHGEPELGRAVVQGRRQEFVAFGWDPEEVPDPQDPSTFERSRLAWSELADADHAATFEWYRALIELRAGEPALQAGELSAQVEHDPGGDWLVVQRPPFVVLANLAPEPRRLPGPPGAVVLASPGGAAAPGEQGWWLDAETVVVVDTRREPARG